jgi:glycosyltransferase involved in cell wall biosynthesis
MPKPTLIIDGRRLTRHATGVGRYLSVLLDTWARSPGTLPFEPTVIRHQTRPESLDPWASVFRHAVVGPKAPGWLWENACLATAALRDQALFAPANLVPYRWRGPVVLVVHDTFCEHADARIPLVNRWRFSGRYRRAAQRADLILTPSAATAQDVRQFFGIPAQRIRVVRPGLAPIDSKGESFASATADTPPIPERFVLYVGKIAARRSFPAVLEAVERIGAVEPLKLVRVGPPLPSPIRSSSLIDLGHVSDDVLNCLYRRAVALVWPSAREGFGLPVLEAMAFGCPVVTTPKNALFELADGACLPLTDVSPETIAAAILRLMHDESLRESLCRAGKMRAAAYDPCAFADEVASSIAGVIAMASSSHHRGGTIGSNPARGSRAVNTQH